MDMLGIYKMIIKHLGKVSNNRLVLYNPFTFKDNLLSLEGKEVEITVGLRENKRSSNQNNLYWKWMTILGKDIGYTKEAMHFVFKKQFLADKMPALQRDEFMEYLQSLEKDIVTTTKLTTSEMKEYMDKVYEQAIELNYTLPTPDFLGIEEK